MSKQTPISPLHLPSDSQLDLLADALGDPTRRAIFKYVAETDLPVTAADVGATFGVHRTVARAHLEKLTDTGLLVTDFLHKPEGGRPPKVYSRSDKRLDLQEPVRQYQVLSELLLHTLERFGDAAELMVRDIGVDFGKQLAASVADDADLGERLAPLAEAGAKLQCEVNGDTIEVHKGNCLFREVATRRPRLVCLMDQAIVTGLLSGGRQSYVLVDSNRRTASHDMCTMVFKATEQRVADTDNRAESAQKAEDDA